MTNELKLNPELLEKAKAAPDAAALITFAKENGLEMTTEQAQAMYTQLHTETGAISDAELGNVAGGSSRSPALGKAFNA